MFGITTGTSRESLGERSVTKSKSTTNAKRVVKKGEDLGKWSDCWYVARKVENLGCIRGFFRALALFIGWSKKIEPIKQPDDLLKTSEHWNEIVCQVKHEEAERGRSRLPDLEKTQENSQNQIGKELVNQILEGKQSGLFFGCTLTWKNKSYQSPSHNSLEPTSVASENDSSHGVI